METPNDTQHPVADRCAEELLLNLLQQGPVRSSTVMSMIPDVTQPVRGFDLSDGKTRAVFHELCAIGDHEAVDFFLSQLPCARGSEFSASVSSTSPPESAQQCAAWSIEAEVGGCTPLQAAAQAGMPHIVRRLLGAGAVERYGQLRCCDALERAMTGAVTQRLPLYLRAMLDAGADPNGSQTLKFPPLLACCRRAVPNLPHVADGSDEASFSYVCAQMLLERGASPNIASKSTHSCPLLMAAKKGSLPLAQLLLKHGAATTAAQWPPLAHVSLLGTAAKFGKSDTSMFKLLLDAGAEPVLPQPAKAHEESSNGTAGAAAQESTAGQPTATADEEASLDEDDSVPATLLGALCEMGRVEAVELLCNAGGAQFAPVHPSTLQELLEESVSYPRKRRSAVEITAKFNRVRSVLAVLARRDAVAVGFASRLGLTHCGDVLDSVRQGLLAEDVCDQDGVLSRPCAWRAFGMWDALSAERDEDEWETFAPASAQLLDLVGGGAAAGAAEYVSCQRLFEAGNPSAWDEAMSGVQTSLVVACIQLLWEHTTSQAAQRASEETGGYSESKGATSPDRAASLNVLSLGAAGWRGSCMADAAVVAASIMQQQAAVMSRAHQQSGQYMLAPWQDDALAGFRTCAALVRFTLRKGPLLTRHRSRQAAHSG